MSRLRDLLAPPAGAPSRLARLELPACLRLADSPPHGVGVFAAAPLPLGLCLGPYEGLPVRTDNAGAGGYSWRVGHGRLVDAGNVAPSKWMRFVNGAPHAARRNLAGFQHRGALYFRTVAPVAVGDELLIYYGDDYASNVDADGYYNYVPPDENLEPELAAMSDGDDYVRNIGIGAKDYSPLKVEPESEFAATGDGCGGGDGDVGDDRYNYGPSKKEQESELGGGDGDGVNGYSDYGTLEENPEVTAKDSDGGGGGNRDDYMCHIGVEAYYDPPKEEPEQELATTNDDAITGSGPDVSYECSHCGVNMCTQEFKVEHELRCKVRMQRKEFESQVTEVYHCIYCSCPFLNKEHREQHQWKYCRKKPVAKKRRSNDARFKCDKCEYVAKQKQNLDRHILTHNKDNAEWFTCTQCSYKTVHKTDMALHTRNHGNNFSYCCPMCGKSFRTKQRLDDHLVKWHFNESDEVSKLITTKVYTCNICDTYRTVVKTAFDRHVTITHLEGVGCEKYECPRCPYSTFRKANLQSHLKTHLDQKNYQCVICKMQFIHKRKLDSHILDIHADDVDLVKTITTKIHRCELCFFKTIIIDKLKSHIRSKHN